MNSFIFQLSLSHGQVRNPHGTDGQEMHSGTWDDDGPGWRQYPKVKAALNPKAEADGT